MPPLFQHCLGRYTPPFVAKIHEKSMNSKSPKPLVGKPLVAKSEWIRWLSAFRYSKEGLIAAWMHEPAVRSELILGVLCVPLAWWLSASVSHFILLVASVIMVVVVELLNSALEKIADLITTDYQPLIKKAKDYGSLAVLLSIFVSAGFWFAAAWQKWG
jgi:diacylglycerol kinase (ATP)